MQQTLISVSSLRAGTSYKLFKYIQMQQTLVSVSSLRAGTPQILRLVRHDKRVTDSTKMSSSFNSNPHKDKHVKVCGRVHSTSHPGDNASLLQ